MTSVEFALHWFNTALCLILCLIMLFPLHLPEIKMPPVSLLIISEGPAASQSSSWRRFPASQFLGAWTMKSRACRETTAFSRALQLHVQDEKKSKESWSDGCGFTVTFPPLLCGCARALFSLLTYPFLWWFQVFWITWKEVMRNLVIISWVWGGHGVKTKQTQHQALN